MIRLALLSLAVATGAAALFGWLPRDRSWQAATGWDHLGEDLKPPGGLSAALFENQDEGPAIHWLGHAGFHIEWSGMTLLLDPNLQDRVTLSRRYINASVAVYTNDIDIVCISHAHYDHMSPTTLKRFPRIGTVVVPAGSEVYLENPLPGKPERRGLDLGESAVLGPLTITAVPARHNGCRHHPWSSKYLAVGYVITDGTNTLYFAGDTGYQPVANRLIKQKYHPDTAILPIGAYAPRIPFKIHHMDPEEAVRAALELGVRLAIPCHFGTYRLTLDAPSTALPAFAVRAADRGLNWSMPSYYE